MLRLSVTSEVDTLLSRFHHSSTSKLSEQGVDGSRGALLKFVFKRWETYGNRRRAMPGSHAETVRSTHVVCTTQITLPNREQGSQARLGPVV